MIMGGGPPFPLDDDSDDVTYDYYAARGISNPSLIRRLWDWWTGTDLFVTKRQARRNEEEHALRVAERDWIFCGCGYRSECRIHCGPEHETGTRCAGEAAQKIEE